MAFDKAQEWGDRIPIGIIYHSDRLTYESQIPALKSGPLVKQEYNPLRIAHLFKEFIP